MTIRLELVTDWDLRERFNRLGFTERSAEGGDVLETLGSDRHPAAPLANEPFCTHSQMLIYYEWAEGQVFEVARAHQYLRPDGTIGLSGKPDPKRVFEDGILYWSH